MIPLLSVRGALEAFRKPFALLFLALVVFDAHFSTVFAQGTAFTYQGGLNDHGVPAGGNYDLQYAIYDAGANGNLVGATLTNSSIAVSNGTFSVALDFGATVFNGGARWMEIGVRSNGNAGAFTVLSPRQQIMSTPYAIQALNAMTAASAGIAGSANSVAAGNISGTVALAQLPGALITNGSSGVNISGTFTGNGEALTNVPGTVPVQVVAGLTVTAKANTSYVLTNTAGVGGVTLPALPNAGDEVSVSGANGWQISPALGQTLLNGTPSGTWIARTSGIQNGGLDTWVGLACSANGTILMAGNTDGALYTSWDSGVTWTERMYHSPPSIWSGAASSSDGSKLIATDQDSRPIYTSSDSGATWAPQTNGIPNSGSGSWSSVACSSDGTKLVALAYFGQIYTSTDSGATWTARMTDAGRNWYCVASSADGTKLVAAVNSGGQVYTSTNSGTNWTAQTQGLPSSGTHWYGVACSADGTKLVAANGAGGQIYTSTDSGVTWTARNSGSRSWMGVASSADGTKLVAVASGDSIYSSVDSGVTWTAENAGINSWWSVACSADGSKSIAGVFGGSSGYIYTSLGTETLYGSGTVTLQYMGNGQWQPLGQSQIAAGAVGNGQVSGLDASRITTGTFVASQIPNLDASKITSGTFTGNGGGLTNLSAANLVNTLSDARLSSNVPLLNGTNIFTGTNRFAGPVVVTNVNNQFAGAFTGNGGALTNLNAANLNNTANLAFLNGTNVFSGTNRFAGVAIVTNANNQFTGAFTGDGSGLTNLSGSQISSGTLSLARLPGALLTNDQSGVTLGGIFSGDGSGMTNLNAANLVNTLSDARLSSNVPLVNGTNIFTGTNRFAGVAIVTNANNQFAGSFTGNGAALTNLPLSGLQFLPVTNNQSGLTLNGSFTGNGGALTNLNAANLTNAISDARLSSNVPLLNGTNVFTGTNRFAGAAIVTNANNQFAGAFTGNGAALTNLPLSGLQFPPLTNNQSGVTLGGSFSGNGAALTNLPFSALQFPPLTNNQSGVTLGGTFSGNGGALTNLTAAISSNQIVAGGGLRLYDSNIWFRGTGDTYQGLGFFGGGKTFGSASPNGPILFGYAGGALGATGSSSNLALAWDSNQNVTVYGTLSANANLSVSGNLTISSNNESFSGPIRMGVENNTDTPSVTTGVITRRIDSRSYGVNSVIARTDIMTLERDGSYGGLLIRYPANLDHQTISCFGLNDTGANANVYMNLNANANAGTVQLYNNSQNIVHVDITFGVTYHAGYHITHVTLDRYDGDFYWMGYLTLTYNQ